MVISATASIDMNTLKSELAVVDGYATGEFGSATFYLGRSIYTLHFISENIMEAVSICLQGISRAKKADLKKDLAFMLMDLSDMYIEQNELNKAYTAIKESYLFAQKSSNTLLQNRCDTNNFYIDAVKFGSSKSKEKLARQANSSTNIWIAIRSNYLLGLLLRSKNKTGKSKKLFKKALNLCEKYNNNIYKKQLTKLLDS
jgi:hypothetical protein